MNGELLMTSSPLEESRPPAVGKEDCSFFRESQYKGMEVDVCEDPPSPPPNPGRWTVSLQCLLDDIQGTDLFQKYLLQEGQDTKCLEFIFACRGVKKTAQTTDREKLAKLVHVLYEKKVKRIACISEESKREIKRKIQSKEIDINIFDVAQRQVEMDISNTTYRTFLMSDLYLQYVSASSEGDSMCGILEEPECLPTLHEDSELHLTERLKKESLRRKLQKSHLMKSRTEPGSIIKSPYSSNYSTYHARYGTCLPTSVQDSELQSISSGAQTDDTMSNADSSVDYSMSRNKQKRLLKNKNVYLNTDTLTEIPKNFVSVIQRMQETETVKKPMDFHEELTSKLNKVIEERKKKERVKEKLNTVESPEPVRQVTTGCASQNPCKPETSVFDFFGPSEDNDQDILDRHVSRVFEDLGQTPVLSPVCVSPGVARPTVDVLPGTSLVAPQDLSYPNCQKSSLASPFSVVGSTKQKPERDTRSSDSGAVTEWISEDNLAASQDSLAYLKPGLARKDQVRRSLRKSDSLFKSIASLEDSGISEVYEPPHSKLNYGQRNMYRGETMTFVSRVAVVQPTDLSVSLRPDTTTNLIEARRRLEGGKSRHASGTPRFRQSFRTSDTCEDGLSQRKQSKKEEAGRDAIVIGYSYGQGTVPYLTRFYGKTITLRNFKSLLTKKGNFKYYFRRVDNAFGTGTVLEEVCDDQAPLPLWEGKVFCVIETVDDPPEDQ